MEDQALLNDAVNLLKTKGFENIRANHENLEKPAKLVNRGSDQEFIPDLTAKIRDGKCYFEIVRKAKRDKKSLIDKWTLLSALASHRNGTFFLLVPHGKLAYTNKILQENKIEAEIIKI
ncbi:MAG: hypothetical protein ACNS62_12660 [Candidatus Cyclobacteriaceae bacterium M3_2C_046]